MQNDFKRSQSQVKEMGKGITPMDSLCLTEYALKELSCSMSSASDQPALQYLQWIQIPTQLSFQESPQENSIICSSQKGKGTQKYINK